jgi:DNA-binding NtrC family response regulator
MRDDTLTRILLVDDDEDVAQMITEHLGDHLPVIVTAVETAREAVILDQEEPHDIALIDLNLPDVDGLQLIRRLRMQGDHAIIVLSGHPTLGRAVEAMRLGAIDLFTKPFDLTRLTKVVRAAMDDQSKAQRERIRHQRLRKLTSRIIKDRRHLRERIDLICRDLVHAYRDLAHKVVEVSDKSNAASN